MLLNGVCRYDCGVIVLKMMEIWDGSKKFDGNTMPAFTNVSWKLHIVKCRLLSFIFKSIVLMFPIND